MRKDRKIYLLKVDKEAEIGYYINVMKNEMLKITNIRENADINNGVCVAVGMFDGVHLGHRAMLDSLVNESKRLGLPSAVYTFDTEDSPKGDRKLLTTGVKRVSLLAEAGVDVVLSSPFSAVKTLSATDFVNNVLFKELGAKSIVCGYDFRFGNNRAGDVELIKELLSKKGVSVITQNAVLDNGLPVSSTLIRSLISNGDIKNANRLLGHSFSIEGEIVRGARIGRTLGFPTANQIYPSSLVLLRFGVYAVRCNVNGKIYGGVANVGMKPTVNNTDMPLCESYLFDYSGDCYGVNVETEFLEFIREEKRFPSLDTLKEQIERDKLTAREILSRGVYI